MKRAWLLTVTALLAIATSPALAAVPTDLKKAPKPKGSDPQKEMNRPKSDTHYYMLLANVHASAFALDEAEDCVIKAIEAEKNPDELPPLHFSLGKLYMFMGRTDEAMGVFDLAVQGTTDPDNRVRVMSQFAQICVDAELFDKAEELILQIRDEAAEPDLRDGISRTLAKVLKMAGRTEEAIAEKEQILAENPNDEEALTMLSWIYINEGNVPENFPTFEAVLDKLEELRPNDDRLLARRVGYYERTEQSEKATRVYERLAELQPERKSQYTLAGAKLYQKAGEMEKCREWIDRMLAGDPDSAEVYALRGSVYQNLGLYDEAIKNHDKAIELVDKDDDMFHERRITRARCLELSGDLEGAEAAYKEVADSAPGKWKERAQMMIFRMEKRKKKAGE